MLIKQCCKSCKYRRLVPSSLSSWCLLRKLTIHADFASYAFCHHWDQKEPSLLALDKQYSSCEKQLDFGRQLVVR